MAARREAERALNARMIGVENVRTLGGSASRSSKIDVFAGTSFDTRGAERTGAARRARTCTNLTRDEYRKLFEILRK